jgi:RNA polymerase sigma-70 factor (ECF subfamily)
MAETPKTDRGMASSLGPGSATSEIKAWFVREVLPLEPLLIRFFRRSGRSDVEDLRQDVYMRVCDAAMEQIPHPAKPFVLAVARNLLIDRVRREHIVSIEAVENLDALNVATDDPGPDQNLMAREELRRLQLALDKLPRRLRAPVVMRKIEGLSRREIAQRLGVSEKTVEKQLTQGVRALADILYGESTEIGSKA